MADDQASDASHVTIEERSSGGLLIGAVLLIALVIGAIYLFNRSRGDTVRTNVLAGAAKGVGDNAGKAANGATR